MVWLRLLEMVTICGALEVSNGLNRKKWRLTGVMLIGAKVNFPDAVIRTIRD